MNATHITRHAVVTYGQHSVALTNAFDSFLSGSDSVRVTRSVLSGSGGTESCLSLSLSSTPTDYFWIFINESQFRHPEVIELIRNVRQCAPAFLHCFCDGDPQDDVPDAWPVGIPPDGVHGIMLTYYTNETFHALDVFRSFTERRPSGEARSVRFGEDARENDPYYPLARALVLDHQRLSTALVQRSLKIGYSHAHRLIDAMRTDDLVCFHSEDHARNAFEGEQRGRV